MLELTGIVVPNAPAKTTAALQVQPRSSAMRPSVNSLTAALPAPGQTHRGRGKRSAARYVTRPDSPLTIAVTTSARLGRLAGGESRLCVVSRSPGGPDRVTVSLSPAWLTNTAATRVPLRSSPSATSRQCRCYLRTREPGAAEHPAQGASPRPRDSNRILIRSA